MATVACNRCRTPVPPDTWNREGFRPCARCGAAIQVRVFPAFFRGLPSGAVPEDLVADGEASCFAHPRKPAVAACETCGRFVCGICEVEIEGRRLCPACVESGRKGGGIATLQNSRVLYDRLALALAVYPVFLIYPSLVAAPAALFVAIRYWKAPRSILGGSRWPSVLAAILALIQIAGWIALAIFLMHSFQAAARTVPRR